MKQKLRIYSCEHKTVESETRYRDNPRNQTVMGIHSEVKREQNGRKVTKRYATIHKPKGIPQPIRTSSEWRDKDQKERHNKIVHKEFIDLTVPKRG